MAITITKDPDEKLDYGRDWAPWLKGDTIQSSNWTVPAGLVEDDTSNTATVAIVWLSGGAAGTSYRVTNRIVTFGGRTGERSFTVAVRDR